MAATTRVFAHWQRVDGEPEAPTRVANATDPGGFHFLTHRERQAFTALMPSPAERKDSTMKFSPKENQMRKIPAIAALGVAGFFGVAACGTAVTTTSAPLPSAAPTDNGSVAREIANIVVGKGGLAALDHGDGQASSATCDPGTVSNPSKVSASTSASCGINYADGSVWKQTVTVTSDSHGNPVTYRTNLGTELLQPTGG
jgi:hypothetical protein